jgi:hypothetical protein
VFDDRGRLVGLLVGVSFGTSFYVPLHQVNASLLDSKLGLVF